MDDFYGVAKVLLMCSKCLRVLQCRFNRQTGRQIDRLANRWTNGQMGR